MQLIKNIHKKNSKYIAFVGDSFCADINAYHWSANGEQSFQRQSEYSFPSLVADHYDYNLLAHGYSGKSWWFSRVQFKKTFNKNPKLIDKLDAIVFCHTDPNRVNSSNVHVSSGNHAYREESSNDSEEQKQTARAQQQWSRCLLDEEFQKWAQINWFRELTREWSHVKQIHFYSFTGEQHNDLLTGTRFTTPLIHISVAELVGFSREIHNQLGNDSRINHLSDYNNRVLASVIIDSIDNYKHEVRSLDISKFHIENPNYANFPTGNYGSN